MARKFMHLKTFENVCNYMLQKELQYLFKYIIHSILKVLNQ